MNSNEQKLIIDNLLSSAELYARCAGIVEGEYFDPEYQNVINYIKTYTDKYGATPDFDRVNAKFDLGFKKRAVTLPEIKENCDSIELFCQQQALSAAVLAALEDIESGNLGAMKARIDKASLISLEKDMGVEMFENPEAYLISLLENDIYYSTGIKGLDDYLDGGLARKQLTLFSANSGGGKSVMLSNLGVNYALIHGMNVLYISLELPETMIYKRNAFIMSGVSAKEWKEKLISIAAKINSIKADGAGSYRVKRLPTGSNTNDIRSYLKQYELTYGFCPDVIIVDYLDVMSPNEGTKNLSVSEQDKQKAEQLTQLLHDYNAIGLSASQQNREAITMSDPNQGVIAGGLTKVNAVDNYVSLYMSPELRAKGQFLIFFLKTRSSDGVGKKTMLSFDNSCLRMGDFDGGGMSSIAESAKKRKKKADLDKALGVSLTEQIEGLPGAEPATTPTPRLDKFEEKLDNSVTVTRTATKRDNVADVGKLLKDSKKTIKQKTALDHMDEEEQITSYGKGTIPQQQAVTNPETGKVLDDETVEFIEKNELDKGAVEFIMSFME